MTIQRLREKLIDKIAVDAKGAAELLSVSERSISEWTASGLIPSRKIGGRRLYSPVKLRTWFEAGHENVPIVDPEAKRQAERVEIDAAIRESDE